jgi:hypothetical protein
MGGIAHVPAAIVPAMTEAVSEDGASVGAQRASEFLLILVPYDSSGLEVEVREFATAQEQDDGLREAQAQGHWRDLIGIYRHPGTGPLSNTWWRGPSTIYERRYYAAQTGARP